MARIANGEEDGGNDEAMAASDRYFFAHHGPPAKTTSTTLADINIVEDDEQDDQGVDAAPDAEAARVTAKVLQDLHATSFVEWASALRNGMNIIVHGFGSKNRILNDFSASYLRDGAVVTLHGHHASASIRELMCTLTEACVGFKPTFKDVSSSVQFLKESLGGNVHSEERRPYGVVEALQMLKQSTRNDSDDDGDDEDSDENDGDGNGEGRNDDNEECDEDADGDGQSDQDAGANSRRTRGRRGSAAASRNANDESADVGPGGGATDSEGEDEEGAGEEEKEEEEDRRPRELRGLDASDGFRSVRVDANGGAGFGVGLRTRTRSSRPPGASEVMRAQQETARAVGACDRLYLVVHSIDAGPLQSTAWCDALSLLAGVPGLSLVASVDHINAGLAWSPIHNFRFRWAWQEVHTFASYHREQKSIALTTSTGRLKASLASTQQLLHHVTANARGVFCIAALDALQGKDIRGMRFHDLYNTSRDKMLVSNEQGLRDHLVEFCDHQVMEYSNNRIKMLLSKSVLNQLKDQGALVLPT